ncbi:MAG: hypothetical protein H0X25_07210 [Acidobacteriales bacterium]|nr:hypothetical protein [Terriglobales bacterium]
MSALLLRPFAYLAIKHGSNRLPALNWGLPVLTAAALLAAGALLAPSANLFHATGLFDRLLGFVQNLPGFYLAALAAVATFGREGLDQLMPGTPPRVTILYNGQPLEIQLTRRRFLTMMFAYLTALSIGITLVLVTILAVVNPVARVFPHGIVAPARVAAAFVIFVFAAQMIIITMWGLYYLGERMHTPDN